MGPRRPTPSRSAASTRPPARVDARRETKRRIRLVHWNAEEAEERAARLLAAGYEVACRPPTSSFLREMRNDPPAAFVIDLSRIPSQGRDIALGLRLSNATRNVPIVFVGGEKEKVARVRKLLPDATYTTWPGIRGALRRAISHPAAEDLVVPRSAMEGYSGVPLAKKLGIGPGSVVSLLGAPKEFPQTLGPLPTGAKLWARVGGSPDLTIWFLKSRTDLEKRIDRMAAAIGKGRLWIAWPKKTSRIASDLTQADVRRIGLAVGLVDYKICAIDATWSGLLFVRRSVNRS
jgi:hypothetical protein